jgi:hypothetical protein
MFRNLLMLFICCSITSVACAQTMQSGTVYENKTRIVLQGIRVENSKTSKYVITDKAGKFSIQAKVGDLLLFTGFFYHADTVLLTNLREREVFLTPKQHMLNEVNVTNLDVKTRQGAYQDPDFHGQTMVYQRDAKYPEYYKGGIAIRLNYWKKDEKKREKLDEFYKKQDTQDEIAKVFSHDNIAKYLPLTGAELDNFILLYIPSVKTYTSTDFNLAAYLDKSYKTFMELPPDKRNAGKLIK